MFRAALEGQGPALCTVWVTNTGLFVDRIRYELDFALWWFEPDGEVRLSDLSIDLVSPVSAVRLTFGRSFDSECRRAAENDATRLRQLFARLIAAA